MATWCIIALITCHMCRTAFVRGCQLWGGRIAWWSCMVMPEMHACIACMHLTHQDNIRRTSTSHSFSAWSLLTSAKTEFHLDILLAIYPTQCPKAWWWWLSGSWMLVVACRHSVNMQSMHACNIARTCTWWHGQRILMSNISKDIFDMCSKQIAVYADLMLDC